MTLPYFFAKDILPAQQVYTLDEATSRHCVQVLRMKTGEPLQLTNGAGLRALCRIKTADKKNCEVVVEKLTVQEHYDKKVCVAISLLKNASRFEWFLEKATEIGVWEIAPLLCTRTEKQHFRYERMFNIVVAAMLQSQQCWLPVLQLPVDFKEAVSGSTYPNKLIAHCEQDKKELLKNLNHNDVQVLIGPEGDFTTDEITFALENNYQAVSLGHNRLRTETAGVVASALLLHES